MSARVVNDDGQPIEACSQVHPDVMFPEEELPADHEDVLEAKRVCGGCGLRDLCLEAAVARRERWGIWGGLTRRERDAMIRRVARGAQRRAMIEAARQAAPGSRAAQWAEQLALFKVEVSA